MGNDRAVVHGYQKMDVFMMKRKPNTHYWINWDDLDKIWHHTLKMNYMLHQNNVMLLMEASGIVSDAGDGLSHIVPIYEGYCLPHMVYYL